LSSKERESVGAVTVADATAAMMVEEGMSTPIGRREEAVAIAERMLVGVAFSRREVSEGSKPGGGCMSLGLEREVARFVEEVGGRVLQRTIREDPRFD
jgi:hypothetical protein